MSKFNRHKPKGHPTREIIRFAQQAPGGVIRWCEAENIYRQESDQWRRGKAFMQNVSRILKTHFTKVDGIRGFYVLDHMIAGDTASDLVEAE